MNHNGKPRPWPSWIAALLLALAGGAAVGIGLVRHATAEAELRTARAALGADRERLRRLAEADEAWQAIVADLGRRRAFGPEPPAGRIDAVARIGAGLRLPGVTAESVAPPDRGPAGAGFVVTPMTLRLDLVHEQDLVDFLADLGRDAPGWIQPRQCRLARHAGDGAAPSLEARCTVDWIRFDTGGPR